MRIRHFLSAAAVTGILALPVGAIELGIGATASFKVALEVAAPKVDITPLIQVHRVPEPDMEVILFLGRHTSLSYLDLWNARVKLGSWQLVMDKYRISPVVIFPPFETDCGPPYGNAWGYWKNKGKGGNAWGVDKKGNPLKWKDDDILSCVRVQHTCAYTGKKPDAVIADLKAHKSWENLSGHERTEKAKKQGKGGDKASADKGGKPDDKGNKSSDKGGGGKGKGKGKG